MDSKFKIGETVRIFHAFAAKPYSENITNITDFDMSGDPRGEPFIWYRKNGYPACIAETFVSHIDNQTED